MLFYFKLDQLFVVVALSFLGTVEWSYKVLRSGLGDTKFSLVSNLKEPSEWEGGPSQLGTFKCLGVQIRELLGFRRGRF